jgi:hypothetical protein
VESVSALEVYGGGTLPAGVGRVNVSIPLVRLRADELNLELAIRYRWLSSLAAALASVNSNSGRPAVGSSISWGNLSKVLVSRRSMILIPIDGRACRFVTFRKSRLRPLVDLIVENGIEIESVRSTILRSFSI